jgi:pantothenate kinase
METAYANLVTRAHNLHSKRQKLHGSQSRTLIALAGPPGSGKTTIAAEVVRRLNSQSSSPYAVVLPMDGFHLSRSTLSQMPNSEEAFERRGAAWTFDAEGVVSLVDKLDSTRNDREITISAPAFDHAEKDPVEDAILIKPDVSLIILEGNWILYDQKPWKRISQIVDDTWFVDVDPELAVDRVAKRHIISGIEDTWEKAESRARGNDLANGEEVRRNLVEPGITIWSVDAGSKDLTEKSNGIQIQPASVSVDRI